MPKLTDCIMHIHRLLVSFAAAGDASPMGDFFKKVYEQLLIPVAAPIGILMFTVGAVMFLLGGATAWRRWWLRGVPSS
jgi:hypothetical protein